MRGLISQQGRRLRGPRSSSLRTEDPEARRLSRRRSGPSPLPEPDTHLDGWPAARCRRSRHGPCTEEQLELPWATSTVGRVNLRRSPQCRTGSRPLLSPAHAPTTTRRPPRGPVARPLGPWLHRDRKVCSLTSRALPLHDDRAWRVPVAEPPQRPGQHTAAVTALDLPVGLAVRSSPPARSRSAVRTRPRGCISTALSRGGPAGADLAHRGAVQEQEASAASGRTGRSRHRPVPGRTDDKTHTLVDGRCRPVVIACTRSGRRRTGTAAAAGRTAGPPKADRAGLRPARELARPGYPPRQARRARPRRHGPRRRAPLL